MEDIPVSVDGRRPDADEMSRKEELPEARSLLEKPLSRLTEEDLAQITREECRRFLKHCGMRRPSWNKSQAIQQVISLKSLLEETASAAAIIRRKPPPPPPHGTLSSPTTEAADGNGELRSAPPYTTFAGENAPRQLPARTKPSPGRDRLFPCRGGADAPAEQLTIFYGGEVSVYDGVPFEKAREIIQFAAAPGPVDISTGAPAWGFPFLDRIQPFGVGPTGSSRSYENAPAARHHDSSCNPIIPRHLLAVTKQHH